MGTFLIFFFWAKILQRSNWEAWPEDMLLACPLSTMYSARSGIKVRNWTLGFFLLLCERSTQFGWLAEWQGWWHLSDDPVLRSKVNCWADAISQDSGHWSVSQRSTMQSDVRRLPSPGWGQSNVHLESVTVWVVELRCSILICSGVGPNSSTYLRPVEPSYIAIEHH